MHFGLIAVHHSDPDRLWRHPDATCSNQMAQELFLAAAFRTTGSSGTQRAKLPGPFLANHHLPCFSIAVGLEHVQLRRAHFINVKMSACIEQGLHVFL